MKWIVLAFICLEIVLASVHHSRREVVKVTIECVKDNCFPCYGECEPVPDATPETKEPTDRYKVIPERYPQRTI